MPKKKVLKRAVKISVEEKECYKRMTNYIKENGLNKFSFCAEMREHYKSKGIIAPYNRTVYEWSLYVKTNGKEGIGLSFGKWAFISEYLNHKKSK